MRRLRNKLPEPDQTARTQLLVWADLSHFWTAQGGDSMQPGGPCQNCEDHWFGPRGCRPPLVVASANVCRFRLGDRSRETGDHGRIPTVHREEAHPQSFAKREVVEVPFLLADAEGVRTARSSCRRHAPGTPARPGLAGRVRPIFPIVPQRQRPPEFVEYGPAPSRRSTCECQQRPDVSPRPARQGASVIWMTARRRTSPR